MNEFFSKLAHKTSEVVGSAWSFILAIEILILWSISGYFFNFSDTWQLVINTFTTIVTFLMVFLIQNTQNRHDKAIQLKLNELIRALKSARNSFVDLEDLSEEELNKLHEQFVKLRDELEARKLRHKRMKAKKKGIRKPNR